MELPNKKYKTILIDPPWKIKMMHKLKRRPNTADELSYNTMTIDEIKKIPINNIADVGCHLWLWTTNQTIKDGFDLMEYWGFKYLAPIHWIKSSGCGFWFVSRSQTCLFGYKDKCYFNKERCKPNVIFTKPSKIHSKKPIEFYKYIECISDKPRIELFARNKRNGWTSLGDEIK